MNKKLTLSVILPNYNDAKTLPRAIEAIVTQSRIPDELLIVDDGSTDESIMIIESYTKKYSYIKLYRNENNMGIPYSINKSLRLITGDFFYGASANDYILPGFFEKGMGLAEKYPDTGIISGEVITEDPTGNKLGLTKISSFKKSNFYKPDSVLNNYFFKENPGHSLCSATIFRSNIAFEFGGFVSELGSYSDTFLARGLALMNGMIYLAFPCAVWIINNESFSSRTCNDKIKLFHTIENCSKLMRSVKYKEFFPNEYIEWWQLYYDHSSLTHLLVKSLAGLQSDESLNLFPKIRNSRGYKKKIVQLFIKFEIFILKCCNFVLNKILIV